MKHVFRILALTGLLGVPVAAHADAVTSFHSDVTVGHSGLVSVQETITYDPGDDSHHGIYRYIPAQFRDVQGRTYYTSLKLKSVTDSSGTAYNIAEHTLNRRQLYLKIGDPNHTITGPHTYVLTYQINPLMVQGDGYDRFIFNVTGEQWATDIDRASADLHFPADAAVTSAVCYTGQSGSQAHDCTVNHAQPWEVEVDAPNLPAGSGLTVDVKLPPGSVTDYLKPGVVPPLSAKDLAVLAVAWVAAVLSVLALSRIMWGAFAGWQARRSQTIIPLYEPPDSLSPAQMSILESPGSDVADITATLIDLAVRGFIKIEQTAPAKWYHSAQYRLTRLPANGAMADYETELLGALFGDSSTVDLQSIRSDYGKSNRVQMAVAHLRQIIGRDLKAKQYFANSPTNYVGITRFLAALVGLVFAAITILIVESGDAYSLWLPFVAIADALLAGGLMVVRTGRTPLGNEEWAKIKGFKWFLEVTEKDRLAFTDAPNKTPELFSKMLPYAVALKVERQWAKQFEGIDTAAAVGAWYIGPAIINSASFTSDFSSSFGSAVSSDFAGSSGAGGAGGGGGGGGGGGW